MPLFIYWFLAPLLFIGVFGGLGLLVRKAAGTLPAELVVPAGFAVAVVVATLLTWVSATAVLAGPALLVLALAGWILSAGALRGVSIRPHLPWIAGGAGAFAAFGASVFLSGKPTFTGYTQIVDIAHQFELAAYIAHHGREAIDGIGPTSSSADLVVTKLLDIGYPAGPQAVLGALSRTFGLEIAWLYQPMLAIVAAALVPAMYRLLLPITPQRGFRLVAAFAASQASLLVGYGQMGGIKELTTALMLATAAVLLTDLTGRGSTPSTATDAEEEPADDTRPIWREALPFALIVASAFAIFSMTIVPWFGLLTLAGVLIVWQRSGIAVAARWTASAGAIVLILSIPSLVEAAKGLKYSAGARDPGELGNLSAPMDRMGSSGIWLTRDYRYPLGGTSQDITVVLSLLVFALAAAGVVVAFRRKAWGILALGVASVVSLALLIPVMGPWVELKVIALTGPVALLFAAIGLSAGLARALARPVSWALLLVLLGAGLSADAMRYRDATLAPYDRFSELRDINEEYAGAHGSLITDFEDHSEYLLRDVHGVSPVESGFEPTPAAAAANPDFRYSWDLDELTTTFLDRFDLIVLRRAPGQSRPPANYEQIKEGRFYTLFRRTGPARDERTALSSIDRPEDRAACRVTVGRAKALPELSFAVASPVTPVLFDPARSSKNLVVQPGNALVAMNGPGAVPGSFEVERAGRYELYLTSASQREITVSVDGRQVASIRRQRAYVGRPSLITTLDLPRGRHDVRIVRPGGSLAPGTHDDPGTPLGPMTVVPAGGAFSKVIQSKPQRSECRQALDWIQIP